VAVCIYIVCISCTSVASSASPSFSFSLEPSHYILIPVGFTNPSRPFVCCPGNLSLLLSVVWLPNSERIESSLAACYSTLEREEETHIQINLFCFIVVPYIMALMESVVYYNLLRYCKLLWNVNRIPLRPWRLTKVACCLNPHCCILCGEQSAWGLERLN
jgi:hypothetical protein